MLGSSETAGISKPSPSKMKPFFLSSLTVIALAIPFSAIAAPKWFMVPLNQAGKFFELDLKSVRLVEKNVYQYRHRLYNNEEPPERRYAYGYDRVDCNNNLTTMMARLNGVRGDGRMHELSWSEVRAGEASPGGEMFRVICRYAPKNPIPKLEPDWDKKPESYIRRQGR